MKFLDTKPLSLDESGDDLTQMAALARYRVSNPDRVRQALTQLQRLEAPVVAGLPQTGAFFNAVLWSVDSTANSLVLHASRHPAVPGIVTRPERLWGAAYDGSNKLQFDLRGRTLAAQGDTLVITSHMPSALFVLPRRADVRARHADGHEPVVCLPEPRTWQWSQAELPVLHMPASEALAPSEYAPRIPASQTVGAPVHGVVLRVFDISRGGLAILAHPDEAPLAVGVHVRGVQVELGAGEVFTADVRVQNVVLHDESDATLRIGCVFTELDAAADQLIQNWTARAQRRKQMLSLSLDL